MSRVKGNCPEFVKVKGRKEELIGMNKNKWKERLLKEVSIEEYMLSSFETTLDILAEILEERDAVHLAYVNDGSRPVVKFTTDRGKENYKPNPLLRTWQDLNVTALQYLRELGLSPAGLRKLQGQFNTSVNCPGKGDALYEFMKECEEE